MPTTEIDVSTEKVALRIAGEIVLSDNPGVAIRKWREIFGVSQKELSRKLKVSSSVISDYESGRRKSPGAKLIARVVSAMVELDEEKGGAVLQEYSKLMEGSKFFEAILAIKEFTEPRKLKDIIKSVEGEFLVGERASVLRLGGYAISERYRDASSRLTSFCSLEEKPCRPLIPRQQP